MVQGGGGGVDATPLGFLLCCNSLKLFYLLIESLWRALQDRVDIMGCSAAEGLWRHPRWPPSWILPKTRNYQKTDEICVEYDVVKHFAVFCQHLVLFSLKREKRIFLQKWLEHLLLMTSGICAQLLKRQVQIIIGLGKIQEKPWGEGGAYSPLYIRGLT